MIVKHWCSTVAAKSCGLDRPVEMLSSNLADMIGQDKEINISYRASLKQKSL